MIIMFVGIIFMDGFYFFQLLILLKEVTSLLSINNY